MFREMSERLIYVSGIVLKISFSFLWAKDRIETYQSVFFGVLYHGFIAAVWLSKAWAVEENTNWEEGLIHTVQMERHRTTSCLFMGYMLQLSQLNFTEGVLLYSPNNQCHCWVVLYITLTKAMCSPNPLFPLPGGILETPPDLLSSILLIILKLQGVFVFPAIAIVILLLLFTSQNMNLLCHEIQDKRGPCHGLQKGSLMFGGALYF